MNPESLKAAVAEAKRFIQIAKEIKVEGSSYRYITGGKESAAVKRASMDLSRALSKMRKSG